MKTTGKLSIFIFTLVVVAVSANAQSPHEELQQMVEQLLKSPNDNALREKIIKLAASVKPAPAVPDAAIAFEGRARFAFEHAKSEDDYLAAAQEYEKAVAAAPWVPNIYFNLCFTYEKAGKFVDAKRNCELYLIGLSEPAQIADVKGRIAGLEFGIEKANSPQAREAALLQKVEGAKFVSRSYIKDSRGESKSEEIYDIRNGTLVFTYRLLILSGSLTCVYGKCQPGEYVLARGSYRDGAFHLAYDHAPDFTQLFQIRQDGQALVAIGGFYNSNPNDRTFGVKNWVVPRE